MAEEDARHRGRWRQMIRCGDQKRKNSQNDNKKKMMGADTL